MKITKKELKKLIESYVINEWGSDFYDIQGATEAPQLAQYSAEASKQTGISITKIGEIILGMLPVTGSIMNAKGLAEALYEIYETGGDEGKMKAVFSALGLVLPSASRLSKIHTVIGSLLTAKDVYKTKPTPEKKEEWKEIADDLIAKNQDLKSKIRPE